MRRIKMSLWYRLCIYLLLALLAVHLLVRNAEASSLQEIKEAMCSQGASIQVGQTEIPVDSQGHVLRGDLPEGHVCKLSVTLSNCGEVLYLTYFSQCMERLKDLPYVHN